MTDDGTAPTLAETVPGGTAPKTPGERYTMKRLLGRGGMGEVWLAHDRRIDREVAIKLMRSADGVDRFLREARVQGRLEHPSIVPVHDMGEGDTPHFVMKRIVGTTLADAISQGHREPWTQRTLLGRFVDACLAIELAHQHGVIHRDIKPANIMLGDFGETYVLDWGLARVAGAAETPSVDQPSDAGGPHTAVGSLLGTPGYMAPEQVRGEVADQRADVFALGCVLYEILVGAPAVSREGALEATLAMDCHKPSRVSPTVAPELDELCAQATTSDRAARLGSARELASAVQRFLDGDRDLAQRRAMATDHATRARQLLEAGENGRGEAMREAGRAIALDAGNRIAQQVLGRLLLEPPRTIPAAAQLKLDREREVALRAVARVGIVSYLPFLLLQPILFALGLKLSWPIAIVCALLVTQLALSIRYANPKRPIPSWLVPVAGCLHVSLVAITGTAFGTLLVLPMVAFGSFPALLLLPALRGWWLVITVHAAGLLLPLGLEIAGAIPRSFKLVGDSIVVRPWAIDIKPTTLIFGMCAVIAIQLIANYVLLGRLRRVQERAQEQLHVQSWQLEQLVESASDDASAQSR